MSTCGLLECPPTARVRTHAKCLFTLSQAAKWASAQAPTVYHATQLLRVPDHLHIVIQTPAVECVGPQAPARCVRRGSPSPAPQPSHVKGEEPGLSAGPCSAFMPPLPHTAPMTSKVKGREPPAPVCEREQYLHREHTPRLVPEWCGGVLGVEGLQSGVGLIGEGCGAQCCEVKDQVVKDEFHPDPGVLRQAWEGRRVARDELRGVHVARLLKLGHREERQGRRVEGPGRGPSKDRAIASLVSATHGCARGGVQSDEGDGYSSASRGRPWVSYMMATTGSSRGARCFWDHAASPPKPLAGLRCSRSHSHSDSWCLYHIQILATDPYLPSSTETQTVNHPWLRRTGASPAQSPSALSPAAARESRPPQKAPQPPHILELQRPPCRMP